MSAYQPQVVDKLEGIDTGWVSDRPHSWISRSHGHPERRQRRDRTNDELLTARKLRELCVRIRAAVGSPVYVYCHPADAARLPQLCIAHYRMLDLECPRGNVHVFSAPLPTAWDRIVRRCNDDRRRKWESGSE